MVTRLWILVNVKTIINREKIVFCNVGTSYIVVGNDAVVLNKELRLKTSYFKPEVCKVGFSINHWKNMQN